MNIFYNNIRILLILIIFGCLLACKQSSDDVDGSNYKDGLANQKVKRSYYLESVKRVVLEENDDVLIGSIIDFQAGRNGPFYLLDSRLEQILVFSRSGRFINRIGRRGGGEQEFRGLHRFDLKNDKIVCWGERIMKFVIFDTLGTFINYFRPELTDLLGGYGVCFGEENFIHHFRGLNKNIKISNNIATGYIDSYSLTGKRAAMRSGLYNEIIKPAEFDLLKYVVGGGDLKRGENSGNIYFNLSGVPIVLEFDSKLNLLRKINVQTPLTRLRLYMPNNQVPKLYTSIYEFDVQGDQNILYLLQIQLTARSSDPRDQDRKFYLSAFDIGGKESQLLVSDILVPSDSNIEPFRVLLDVGADGLLYLYEDDRPDHNTIGIYRLVCDEKP